jgi:hypothetical protein
MERAKQYKMKQNLEIPKTFKGNSFAVLDTCTLSDACNVVDVTIGNNIDEEKMIITDLVNMEYERSFHFAKNNPEVVLPLNLDINTNDLSVPSSNDIATGKVGWATVGRGSKIIYHPL